MIYTEGIRKIFTDNSGGVDYAEMCRLAEKAGYKALSYGGVVYTYNSKIWLYTCFKITDFMVGAI